MPEKAESFSVIIHEDGEMEIDIDVDPTNWSLAMIEMASNFPPEVLLATGNQLVKMGEAGLK